MARDDTKRYYWLKLDKDFFKRHDIRIIESMPNGKDYILFYLKLICESTSHEGRLRFSDTIPYNNEMLATITNTNMDVVRAAMTVFTELNMIQVLDDETIYMAQVEKMIGSESHSTYRKRLYKESVENPMLLEDGAKSAQICPKSATEIEKEIEKEIEIEKEKKKKKKEPEVPKEVVEVISYLNEKLGTRYKATTKENRELINGRLSEGYSVAELKEVIDKKYAEWHGTDMQKFLRPNTLFRPTNFENYLNQPWEKKKMSAVEIARMMDEAERRIENDEGTGSQPFGGLQGSLPEHL